MEVFKDYRFEAAHWLPQVPEGHPCGNMHGHSYRISIRVAGALRSPTGWVVDFSVLDAAFLPLRDQLDHAVLNEVEGLENPTCENLALWFWHRLTTELPGLSRIEAWETHDAGCVLSAGDPELQG